jgi:16S rRNA G966 N2-methylase RsmD
MSKIQKLDKRYLYLFPKEEGVDRLNLQITDESIYSVTKPYDAKKIIKLIKFYYKKELSNAVITDGTANVGGDSINFSKYFKTVNAVEINRLHCDALENNINEYKRNNINIVCNDYLKVMTKLKQDIIYLDPPWGGPDYKKEKSVNLFLGDMDISDIIIKLKKKASFFVIKAPYNFNYKKFYKTINANWRKAFLLRKKILILIFSFENIK